MRPNHPVLFPLLLTALVLLAVPPGHGQLPDLTGDGKADRTDLVKLARMADKRETPDTKGDLDGDGLVTIWDVERYASGLDMLPIRTGSGTGGGSTGGGTGGTVTGGGISAEPGDLVDILHFYKVWQNQPKFGQDHRYGTEAGTAKAESEGYVRKPPAAFRVWRESAAGLTPLYEYVRKDGKDHLYTIHQKDPVIEPEYRHVGIVGYVSPVPVEGAVPLYRYWSADYEDHFYTTSLAEGNTAAKSKSYVTQGVECYVMPGPAPVVPEKDPTLVFHLPLDGGLTDVTGNKHDGMALGAVLATDRQGTEKAAYRIVGKRGVAVRNVPRHATELPELTLALWVSIAKKPAANQQIGGTFYWGNRHGWCLKLSPKGGFLCEAYLEDGKWLGVSSTVEPEPGRWYHVAGTFGVREGRTIVQIYVDGELKGEKALDGGVRYRAGNWLHVGDNAIGNEPLVNASVDDVRLYSRVLSASDMAVLAAGGVPAPPR